MNLTSLILIFLGGGLGSLSRFGIGTVSTHFYSGKFPVGTLISNTLACLIVAGVLILMKEKISENDHLKQFLIIGFCGGFSTFSAFSLETVKLIQNDDLLIASINVLLSLIIGIGTIYLILK